jgi:hypothetical protein
MRLIATIGHPLFSPTKTTAIFEREACEINGYAGILGGLGVMQASAFDADR